MRTESTEKKNTKRIRRDPKIDGTERRRRKIDGLEDFVCAGMSGTCTQKKESGPIRRLWGNEKAEEDAF
jgi:hypothetical protein